MTTEILPYISDSVELSSSTPATLDIEKMLGTTANVGYVTSDDGQILIQINSVGGIKITLEADDTLNFKRDEEWILRRIYITTTSVSALTVRYMFKKTTYKLL